ncbi:MAG TPA: septum site-determining protein MinC [Candidatus Baltobacteraceae bacterium]|jgi:septum site-determining protein MinC|nr:septum site-determining protein MinC [Candidatus Baltobacteraceae bacterium]
MAVLRGKGMGLELALGGRDFGDALAELQGKLVERPGFYTGASAVAALGATSLTQDQLDALSAVLNEHGIGLEVLTGGLDLEPLALANGLRFVLQIDDGGEELARRRALRPKREVQLSDAARSLVADFAGARADIASRRKLGETSVRRAVFAEPPPLPKIPEPAPSPPAAPLPSTMYHTGTLRGGQSLHNVGNIVVVGDVNPGAELVATGDILVFGALRGVAHAGAQGDITARVHALELAATQLRIAAYIAADSGERAGDALVPETACVKDGRIAIFPRGTTPQ